MSDTLIAALQGALATDPNSVELRLHLCEILSEANQHAEALAELRTGLALAPADVRLLRKASEAAAKLDMGDEAAGYLSLVAALGASDTSESVGDTTGPASGADTAPAPPPWHQPGYEQRPPAIPWLGRSTTASSEPNPANDAVAPVPPQEASPVAEQTSVAPAPDAQPHDPISTPEAAPEPTAERIPNSVDDLLDIWNADETGGRPEIGELATVDMTLEDVGGMEEVKKRLQISFLAPMRNPEMRELFGKSMRGGLLLWGPPGCGKTFIARAVAGELGASFYHVGLSDVLDMWAGSSERNVSQVFEIARANSPCVLFLDEVDALGHKRSGLRSGGSVMRGVVNQLLQEMDGAAADNEGVFVLAATNHPWDIDSALLRPGRLDRMLLVLPPDTAAREAILQLHFRGKPTIGLDTQWAASVTEGLTGADLALVCEQATEYAMIDSIESGDVRPIDMDDLRRSVGEIKPSHGPWFEAAKNYALFSNDSGNYDELLAYIRGRR